MKLRFAHYFCTVCLCYFAAFGQTKNPIILDADTANEVDDLFAIVRAFSEENWEIQALNATQWQSSQWASAQTMEDSHRLNQVLFGYLKPSGTILCRGGQDRMYDWGDMAQHSKAAYNIIAQANKMVPGSKLTVIALGALTNVASAVYIEPSIASKIRLYWLGSSYDFKKERPSFIDFNSIMDPQAVHMMLASQVEMHIMPVSEVQKMTSGFEDTKNLLKDIHPLADFLVQRWFDHIDGGREERVLWDVALIEAMIHPEWVTEVKVSSFENPNVFIYKDIDKENFLEDCFNSIIQKIEKM